MLPLAYPIWHLSAIGHQSYAIIGAVGFIARIRRLREIGLVGDLVLSALFCIPLFFAVQLYQPVRSTLLIANAAQAVLPLDGFFALERFPNAVTGFRWMQQHGTLELPNPGGSVLLRLTLFGVPAQITPVDLHVAANNYRWTVTPEPRHYEVLLPPSQWERRILAFDEPTQRINNRDLGLALIDVRVTGGSATPIIPLALLAFAALSGYAAVRLAVARALPIIFLLALKLGLLAVYLAAAWRFPLFLTCLALCSGQCLALIGLERARQIGNRWLRIAADTGVCVALGIWLAATAAGILSFAMLIGLAATTYALYLLLRQAAVGMPAILGISLGVGLVGLLLNTLLGSMAVLIGPGLIYGAIGILAAVILKRGIAGRSIRYETTLSACLLFLLLVYGTALNVQQWSADLSQEDIAFIWQDGTSIAAGINPYARVETVITSGNNKFSTYFPLFYLLVALTNKLGVVSFSGFIALWRYGCLAFNLLIAVLIYSGLARRSNALLGVFFAGIWLLNIWSLHVARVLQIDFLPISFLLLSILLFDRQPRMALLCFGVSLAIKQIGIFLLPVYLILIWQRNDSAPSSKRPGAVVRELAGGLALMLSIPLLVSLPFLIWDAESFIRSILISVTRNPETVIALETFDHLTRQIFPDFSGTPTKLPMLLFMLLIYGAVFQRKIGLAGSTFGSIVAFTILNSVLFFQYWAWFMAVLPLLWWELGERGVRSQKSEVRMV
ncbi:MAG: hypothetical protein SH847_13290 [Roseiflexaceae bacterium]|nr:hypothetical protein [Roseiflexaceae bacterium]